MRIDHQILTGVSSPARATATAQRWLVGQLLTIGVIGRVDESSIRLSVDGQELVARTPLDLPPGTQLRARVLATGAQPLLQILDPRPGAPLAAGTNQSGPAVVRGALSAALPVQDPLDQVFDRLVVQRESTAAPPGVRAQIASLTDALPDLPTLARPAQLARAVASAGTLLEATLATLDPPASKSQPSAAAPTHDLKFQLLALREAIDVEFTRLPREAAASAAGAGSGSVEVAVKDAATSQAALRAIADDVDAGIARITTHQLQHVAAAERGEFYAFAELPFRTTTGSASIALAIDGDDAGHGRREDRDCGPGAMSVTLAVPLADEVGELRARIGLSGERLALTLWSEDSALRELMAEDIGMLEERLTALGFELTPIVMRQVDAPDPLRQLPSRLVDTSI